VTLIFVHPYAAAGMAHLDLDSLARSLIAAGFREDVRGDGAARFVFARARERAVPASNAGVWIEYSGGGDDDGPKFDHTFQSANAALTDATAWLSGDAG
jgi:hypothetical protein